MPDNDAPVRDTLAVMTAASIENSDLPPREFMIVRLAALAAVDAPATSYALNVEAATDAGLTLDDVQDVLPFGAQHAALGGHLERGGSAGSRHFGGERRAGDTGCIDTSRAGLIGCFERAH